MINSWYECGSRIVNRHTGMAFRCRPKSFMEAQVERLGPEGAQALLNDVRMHTLRRVVREVLTCLADERKWNALSLCFELGVSDTPLCLALEALVQTDTIEGPSPYENEPTGDMSELVYCLPSLENDPPWDDGGEEYPF